MWLVEDQQSRWQAGAVAAAPSASEMIERSVRAQRPQSGLHPRH